MPRSRRITPGGVVYHVLNRANARITMFKTDADYAEFEQALQEAHEHVPIRVLSYCMMPDHWHLILWPRREGELSEFMRRLTVTHTRRWHARHHSSGTGHLYQGRYRSFPIEPDDHLLTVCRYVESNPVRADKVRRSADWEWSSLSHRKRPAEEMSGFLLGATDWPIDVPRNFGTRVDTRLEKTELALLQKSAQRGTPFGSATWQQRIARRLGLESTMRPRGRPRKLPSSDADTSPEAPAARSRRDAPDHPGTNGATARRRAPRAPSAE